MKAAAWIGRILCGIAIMALYGLQGMIEGDVKNTLGGVAQHVTVAAIVNAAEVVLAAYLVRGAASYDMQLLAFCAVIVNFLSFVAYAAKNSPMVFFLNHSIMVISYVQFARLIWPSNGSPLNYRSRGLFLRFAHLPIASVHFKKEKS